MQIYTLEELQMLAIRIKMALDTVRCKKVDHETVVANHGNIDWGCRMTLGLPWCGPERNTLVDTKPSKEFLAAYAKAEGLYKKLLLDVGELLTRDTATAPDTQDPLLKDLTMIECDMCCATGHGVRSEHVQGDAAICDDCWAKNLRNAPRRVLRRLVARGIIPKQINLD